MKPQETWLSNIQVSGTTWKEKTKTSKEMSRDLKISNKNISCHPSHSLEDDRWCNTNEQTPEPLMNDQGEDRDEGVKTELWCLRKQWRMGRQTLVVDAIRADHERPFVLPDVVATLLPRWTSEGWAWLHNSSHPKLCKSDLIWGHDWLCNLT